MTYNEMKVLPIGSSIRHTETGRVLTVVMHFDGHLTAVRTSDGQDVAVMYGQSHKYQAA